MPEKIVVFGAGGHAKVVVDAIEMAGAYEVALLADANPARVGGMYKKYPVCHEDEGFSARAKGIKLAFVAVGHNETRKFLAKKAIEFGFQLVTIVHPAAIVSKSATLGVGTLVMPGSVINADADVGSNTIINTGAVVEHDCRVGNNVHIAPRVALCGGVVIGDDTLIGVGAAVLPGVKLGAGVVVGAGAIVISSINDGEMVKGMPARVC